MANFFGQWASNGHKWGLTVIIIIIIIIEYKLIAWGLPPLIGVLAGVSAYETSENSVLTSANVDWWIWLYVDESYVRNQNFKIDIPHINLDLLTSIAAAADQKIKLLWWVYLSQGQRFVCFFWNSGRSAGVLCMRGDLPLPIKLLPLLGREQWSPRAKETEILRHASWTGPCVRQRLWSIFGSVPSRTYPLWALCCWHPAQQKIRQPPKICPLLERISQEHHV